MCRSTSFNRTDGACHLSAHNQLSKPKYIRLNNDPNYRIDYYESNCYDSTFKFTHECRPDGVLVKVCMMMMDKSDMHCVQVTSEVPYTGALYGLYDYFTCRVTPESRESFQHFFPFASVSTDCADSMRKDTEASDGAELRIVPIGMARIWEPQCRLATRSSK